MVLFLFALKKFFPLKSPLAFSEWLLYLPTTKSQEIKYLHLNKPTRRSEIFNDPSRAAPAAGDILLFAPVARQLVYPSPSLQDYANKNLLVGQRPGHPGWE